MAVSEVYGSLLSIMITVVAGTAVWGFVRLQAGSSEQAYANNMAATNNFLNEQFKVVDLNFPATSSCPGTTSTGCITFWIYNTGGVAFSPFKVRMYDSAGLVNIQYNYTGSVTKTDYVYDLRSSQASKCKTAASSYESTPTISAMALNPTNVQLLTLTIPTAAQGGCSGAQDPSYGQTLSSGTTYSITVTGLYGNSVTYYQTK